ncbi:MAG TPA: DUF2203 domain-containing protein [Isosphaeraceae bacterium]|jgi:hypothetical protein|nr:DUF2203 domain-containing protein [Isosphaeraceae bacterium]
MAPPKTIEAKRKHFTVEEANKALPLVKVIVSDIVRQFQTVNELTQRLSAVMHGRKTSPRDPYAEELAQSKAEMEAEEAKLRAFREELTRLGVELKGPDGLCDFPSLMEGREVYLCWRLGEPEVMYWHEIHDGFPGRRPLKAHAAATSGNHMN